MTRVNIYIYVYLYLYIFMYIINLILELYEADANFFCFKEAVIQLKNQKKKMINLKDKRFYS